MAYIILGLLVIIVVLSVKLYQKKNIKLPELTPFENDIINEQFLKYVSDSRDWAYEYIENIQKEILLAIETMTPVVNFIKTKKSYTYEEAIINNVYNKLKEMLPEQD